MISCDTFVVSGIYNPSSASGFFSNGITKNPYVGVTCMGAAMGDQGGSLDPPYIFNFNQFIELRYFTLDFDRQNCDVPLFVPTFDPP